MGNTPISVGNLNRKVSCGKPATYKYERIDAADEKNEKCEKRRQSRKHLLIPRSESDYGATNNPHDGYCMTYNGGT